MKRANSTYGYIWVRQPLRLLDKLVGSLYSCTLRSNSHTSMGYVLLNYFASVLVNAQTCDPICIIWHLTHCVVLSTYSHQVYYNPFYKPHVLQLTQSLHVYNCFSSPPLHLVSEPETQHVGMGSNSDHNAVSMWHCYKLPDKASWMEALYGVSYHTCTGIWGGTTTRRSTLRIGTCL